MAQEDLLKQAAELLFKIANEREEELGAGLPTPPEGEAGADAGEPTVAEPAVEPAPEPVPDAEPVVFKCDKCDHSANLDDINAKNSEAGVPEDSKVLETDRVGCPQCGTGVMSSGAGDAGAVAETKLTEPIPSEEVTHGLSKEAAENALLSILEKNHPEVKNTEGLQHLPDQSLELAVKILEILQTILDKIGRAGVSLISWWFEGIFKAMPWSSDKYQNPEHTALTNAIESEGVKPSQVLDAGTITDQDPFGLGTIPGRTASLMPSNVKEMLHKLVSFPKEELKKILPAIYAMAKMASQGKLDIHSLKNMKGAEIRSHLNRMLGNGPAAPAKLASTLDESKIARYS